MMADENDKLFITEKGRGIAEYYYIVDRPDEKALLSYIKVSGHLHCLNLAHLEDKFGKGVASVLDECKVPVRSDGGYYIN